VIELIGDLPVRCARVHATKDATVFKGARRSFSEFNQRVNRCAHALRRLGLERGDHVAVLARNRPEALEICFAAAKLGAVHLPVNFRLAASDLHR
jgi:fatty-acyl-CoA synthase